MQTHLCALQYLEKGVAHRSVRRKEKMEKEYDVLVVGPVSLDHNIDYLGNERSEVGGAVVASGWAAAGSGAKAAIFCKLNPEEADVNERFEGIKADLYWKPSAHTCSIRNQYFTADKEKRACTSLGKCDPFRFDEMADIKTKMYHFAGLVYGDFDGELIRESAKHGKVAVDVQCMLRHVEPDKTMAFHDWADKKEILPLIVAQEYPDFEVVIVYVGRDTDFYDDLVRIKQSFPQIPATKIELNPRFPISPKMALNVGIKSAHYEHLLFTTPDVYPTSDRWLSLMANGFRRGEIVLGYCGMERGKGFANYLIRTWRMMHSVDWISSAVCGRPYRGMRQNYGFTKRLYFGANGFSHLNMNIGEDDLFMSRIIAPGNVSVVLSPRATLREKSWGGLRWWIGTQRFFGGAIPFYPLWVKNFIQWELGSRILFWLAAIVALAVMPWEFKIAAGVLLLARFAIVLVEARRISRRLGEEKICGRYFLYDLLSPFFALLLGLLLLRKDERVWR